MQRRDLRTAVTAMYRAVGFIGCGICNRRSGANEDKGEAIRTGRGPLSQ